MNILIAGGSGFIGSKLAEKFLKDGHGVTVVDIVEPSIKLRPRSRASFYKLNIGDLELEEVFKDKPLDVVINCTLATNDNEETHLSMITGNINLVSMTIKYKVKKFVYLSNSEIDILESSLWGVPIEELGASKYFVLNKKTSEEYCFEAFENSGVQKMIIRLPMVFGIGMKLNFDNYFFTRFIENILSNKQGIKSAMLKAFDVIYINDCIGQIMELISEENSTHKFYRLEGNTICAKEFVDFISSIYPIDNIEIDLIDTKGSESEKKKIVKVLKSKNSNIDVENGLKQTFEWFIEKRKKKENYDKKRKIELPIINKKVLYSISENLLGLLLAYIGCIVSNGHFDANLPYIMFMGMRYGLLNAFIAVCFGVILKLFILNSSGTLHLYEFIFMMLSYLLTAFISSFVTDKQKGHLASSNEKLKLVEEKLDSMSRRLNQSRKTISNLSEQIKVSDKSFGKVHQATRKLDSFDVGKLFDEMKNVVVEITNFEEVYIYTVNRNEWMLDLYTKSREDIIEATPRINIYEQEVFRELMFKRKLFINKQMENSLPGAIIPIVDEENERVEAMIIIKNIPFDSLNAFTEYNLQMTGELLSDALTRAYKFENMQNSQNCRPGLFDNWMEESNG